MSILIFITNKKETNKEMKFYSVQPISLSATEALLLVILADLWAYYFSG